jgi:hypothetical protein
LGGGCPGESDEKFAVEVPAGAAEDRWETRGRTAVVRVAASFEDSMTRDYTNAMNKKWLLFLIRKKMRSLFVL